MYGDVHRRYIPTPMVLGSPWNITSATYISTFFSRFCEVFFFLLEYKSPIILQNSTVIDNGICIGTIKWHVIYITIWNYKSRVVIGSVWEGLWFKSSYVSSTKSSKSASQVAYTGMHWWYSRKIIKSEHGLRNSRALVAFVFTLFKCF